MRVNGDRDALEQLLQQAAAGDREAFGLFYDQTSVPAYSLARLADPERPECLLSEAYAVAWHSLHQRGSHRPLPWLLAIVQQTARRSPSPTG